MRTEGGKQFVLFHGHGANLAHHDAGGNVGKLDGVLGQQSGGQAQGQHGNHGVSGAGNVEDLAGLRREQ